jgi:hypothetical protein
MSSFEIRPYRPGDADAVASGFHAAFGAGDPVHHPRTAAEWRWAYAENPAGMRAWVAVDGTIIAAHFAALPGRTRIDGDERVFAQLVDTWVHPDCESEIEEAGLLVELGQAMLAATCGPDKDLVVYGYPTAEAWRIGRLHLAFEMVRRQTVLVRDGSGSEARAHSTSVSVLPAFDERVRHLYDRCSKDWRASTVRDERYLNWRVHARPGRPYAVLAVCEGQEIAGYAVVRERDRPIAGAALICDWLVPPERTDVAAALLAAAAASGRGADRSMAAMFPQWSPWFAWFQEQGFLVQATPYAMVSAGYSHPHYDTFWLRDHWWYQPLDLDFV